MSGIILASKSPRRQELIRLITEDFEVVVSDAEEAVPRDTAPESVPELLASVKAEAAARLRPGDTVIGADTVVILDGKVMGKPADREDAVRMLRSLSGRVHTVVTGCCIIGNSRKRSFSDVTSVEFYPLSDREIIEYVDTGEPFDKAGAYGIQGKGSLLVKGIRGDFFNVMGLPVAKLRRELQSFGAL